MADIGNLKKVYDAHGQLLDAHVVGEIARLIGELHEVGGRRATRFVCQVIVSSGHGLMCRRDFQ
jgi:hypothetical protein